jgi:hypothetical protein
MIVEEEINPACGKKTNHTSSHYKSFLIFSKVILLKYKIGITKLEFLLSKMLD